MVSEGSVAVNRYVAVVRRWFWVGWTGVRSKGKGRLRVSGLKAARGSLGITLGLKLGFYN